MPTLSLKKPAVINGETVDHLDYDLEGLTGDNVDAALRELSRSGVQVGAVEVDPAYHGAVFAQAAGITYDDLKRLSAWDFQKAAIRVRSFFLHGSAEPSDQKK